MKKLQNNSYTIRQLNNDSCEVAQNETEQIGLIPGTSLITAKNLPILTKNPLHFKQVARPILFQLGGIKTR